ncbi:NAD(P)H-dependent oxidoreductase [Devosia sp.]|uniref:NADPH-dependent FMN reductase n=1 Tax=Devosia sp. TaxID=1871048 RepID=UPI001AC74518|nr:NAD(P)H-dependent oxidoreductase [Devosia sp.]MBN9310807.1 NAD(P)H-dependent oxidoreductase [Devosia sp.]
MTKPKIAVIVGSIRPTRFGDKPAKWIADHAAARGDIDVEIVDLKDYPLPLFDAAASDFWMPTPNEVAAKWQAKLSEFDGYIFVTAEYNRSVPGALKNAIDWAYKPFIKKASAFVAYGSVGGARAVEHLRNIMVELQSVPVRHAIHIGGSDFMPIMMGQQSWDDAKGKFDMFVPELLDNLVWWTNATKTAREADASKDATKAA